MTGSSGGQAFVTDKANIFGNTLAFSPRDEGETDFKDVKIAALIRHAEGKDVLDLGCVQHNPESYRSRYWVHRALKAKAKSVLGLDLSEFGVDYLRERGFDVVLADAQAFSLDRKFDVIVAGDIIEHLEDFSGFLTSCKAHLRPGSSILVQTPNPWYWRNIVKAVLHKEVDNNPEHTCWLCPRTLRQLVNRHGMDIDEVQFFSRYAFDKIVPLPRGLKHPAWMARVFVR